MYVKSIGLLSIIILSFAQIAFANAPNAKNIPVEHCYHWLAEKSGGRLTFKYQHAEKNNGDLINLQGTNGAMAGPGLYCAKTLEGSRSYGDRVIRIEFTPDVVFDRNSGAHICPPSVDQATCDAKPVDVSLYAPGNDFYVIKNLNSIMNWTANGPELLKEIEEAKGYWPSSASAYQDLIATIKAEVQKIGTKVYYPGSSRFAIKHHIDDDNFIRNTNPVDIIRAVAQSPDSVFNSSQKRIYLNKFVPLALKPNPKFSVSYDSLMAAIGDNSTGKEIVANAVRAAINGSNNSLSLTFMLSALSDNSWTGSESKTKAILRKLVADPKNLDEALKASGKNADIKEALLASLPPPPQFLSNISASNALDWVAFFNDNIDRGNSQRLNPYLAKAIEKAMAGASSDKIFAVLDGVKNPLCDTSKILQQLIDSNSLIGDDADFFEAVKTVSRVKDKLSNTQVAALSMKLKKLKITSDKPAYMLMQELIDDKVTLPDFVSVESFIQKLIEKSIAEKTDSNFKMPTNIYRFIFENLAYYYRKIGAKDVSKMDEAKDVFLRLALWLESSSYPGYSYIALQNSGYFETKTKYSAHPMESFFSNATAPQKVQKIIANSADTSLLNFLMAKYEETKSDTYKKPLKWMMDSMINNDFDNYAQSKSFKTVEKDKAQFANRILDTKVHSDYCHFLQAVEASAPKLASIGVGGQSQIESKAKYLFTKGCN